MAHLDPAGESEEEHAEEQRAIHQALRNESFDSEELHFPSRADFHPRGMKKAVEEYKKHLNDADGQVRDSVVNVGDKEVVVKTIVEELPADKNAKELAEEMPLDDSEGIEIAENGGWRGPSSMSHGQET